MCGIVVFNTPGANANAVKELVAAALLLGSRDIFGGMNYVQSLDEIGDSAEMHKTLEKNKKNFAGSEISGMTLGVVGLGAIGALVARARNDAVKEVILATNATVDGQTTAHYIADELEGSGVTITTLAQGVPIGGELDYLDDGTISAALKARKSF